MKISSSVSTKAIILIATALALGIILAACRGSDNAIEPTATVTAPEPDPIVLPTIPTEWKLLSLNGTNVIGGSNITLDATGNQVGGWTGCNAYYATFTVDFDGSLSIGDVGQTEEGCPTSSLQQQERDYVKAMGDVTSFRLDGDRLELLDRRGTAILVYSVPQPSPPISSELIDTHWQLIAIDDESPPEGPVTTLLFTGNAIGGIAACRSYSGTYEAVQDDVQNIQVFEVELKEPGCASPENIGDQETRYVDALHDAVTYHLTEESLEIITKQDHRLVFIPLAEEAGSRRLFAFWTLTEFDDRGQIIPIIPETEISMLFEGGVLETESQLGGMSGCNSYGSKYTSIGSSLIIGESTGGTLMLCEEPTGIIEQERRFIDFLRDVRTYKITGNQLRLETDDDRALIFTFQEWFEFAN